jgi:hypothetical protein
VTWTAIKETKNSAVVEIFLRRYSEGLYGDLARQRLAMKALDAVALEESKLKALEIQREIEKRRVTKISPPVTPTIACASQAEIPTKPSRACNMRPAARTDIEPAGRTG